MERLMKAVHKTAKVFNTISMVTVVVAMALVVVNVILRTVFDRPILGTYEYTGILTALMVGFGISYCLVKDAHIFIDFITQKLRDKTQGWIHLLVNGGFLIFLTGLIYYVFRYALRLMQSGSVTPTTQFPFYIVVWIMGLCFVMLWVVLLTKLAEYYQEVSSS